MTFDQAHLLLKRVALSGLQSALEAGLAPNLSNRVRFSLLMLVAVEGTS